MFTYISNPEMSSRNSLDTVAELSPEEFSTTTESSATLLAGEKSLRWTDGGPNPRKHRLMRAVTFMLVALVILISLTWSIIEARYSQRTRYVSTLRSGCGNSAAEAQAKGCHFDMMSWLWVPHECFDAELVEDFIQLRDWKWYTSHRGLEKDRVPLADVKTGMYDSLWAPQEYHMWHCTYMWKKMHRTILRHGPIDNDVANYNHTLHCEKMLLEPGSLSAVNTLVTAEFASCSYI